VLHRIGPVQRVQIPQQQLRIFGDAQKPLLQLALLDRRIAPFAAAIDDLFVGQHSAIVGTPVDGRCSLHGQPGLEQLEKNPLRPAVIRRVGGIDFVSPVEATAAAFELCFSEALDVARRQLARMHALLDGEVFGVNAEGVETHRFEYVIAAHRHIAGEDICPGKAYILPTCSPSADGYGNIISA